MRAGLQHFSIHNFQQGDADMFRMVYERFVPVVYRVAYEWVRDSHLADDIVAGVMVKLWTNRANVVSQEHLFAYLYTAVKNSCIDHLRRNARREKYIDFTEFPDIPADDALKEEELFQEVLLELMKIFAERLPVQCKKVFQYYLEGISYDEISEIMGIQLQTVYNQIAKAKRQIKKLADEHFSKKNIQGQDLKLKP